MTREAVRETATDVGWGLLVAALLAVLLAPLVAWGQAADAPEPESISGAVAGLISGADPLVQFLASGTFSTALVMGVVLWSRRFFPRTLAPEPSTDRSRMLNLIVALSAGLVLGVTGFAPAVPIPGRELVGGVLIVARLLGGFMVATAAVFGRDFFVRGQGALDEAREAKAARVRAASGEDET